AAPREEEAGLRNAIQQVALKRQYYGYRRIGAELRRAGWQVNKKRGVRLVRGGNLLCLRKEAFVSPADDSRHGFRVYPNLARHLEPTAINQLWVGDITYVRLAEEFAYLAVLLDAFSRRAIGWALERHLQASLALAALEMALSSRAVVPGALVHH